MGRRIAGGAVLALLLLAGPASAATRYAADGASGPNPCAEVAPCGFVRAVQEAGDGDTVLLLGTFFTVPPDTQVTADDLTIRPATPGARTVLQATGTSYLLTPFAPGLHLSDLDLRLHDGTTVINPQNTATGFLGERLRINASGTTGYAMSLRGGPTSVVRDSVMTSESTVGGMVTGGLGGKLVNVIVSGAIGLTADANYMTPGQTQQLDIVNSIIAGFSDDLRVEAASDRTIRIDVSHSNYDVATVTNAFGQVVLGAGNQTAAPSMGVDGLHQAPGSPTIDAGTPTPLLGATDFFGSPRFRGARPTSGSTRSNRPPRRPSRRRPARRRSRRPARASPTGSPRGSPGSG